MGRGSERTCIGHIGGLIMSTEEKFILVDNDFIEKGLTLDEAYILGRVRTNADFTNVFHETNEEIAKAMGKSVSSVKRCINSLVKKGYLRKEHNWRCRMLYSTSKEDYYRNWNGRVTYLKTMIEQSINGLSSEEKVQRIQEALNRKKPRNEEDIYYRRCKLWQKEMNYLRLVYAW